MELWHHRLEHLDHVRDVYALQKHGKGNDPR